MRNSTPPTTNEDIYSIKEKSSKNTAPQGLKGWLILVAFIIFKIPIALIFFTYTQLIIPLFITNEFKHLTHPASEYYIPAFKFAVIGEISVNILLILIWCALIFLFFSKKILFKKVFIFALISMPTIILADAIYASYLLEIPVFDKETSKELFRGCISAAIWVSYTLKSKRVANTFIN